VNKTHKRTALSMALALALACIGTDATAADGRDREIAELKAQLAALQARVAELDARTEAQSGMQTETRESLDKLTNGTTRVETRGGIKATSSDGRFEFGVGGRIHYDAYAFDRDLADVTGTTDFRRARLTLSGKALGWEYKVEQDFSAGSTTDGFRDVYIARKGLGGKFTIGHFKPYRSMEELTSSNEITMMERPFASATGIYGGRQFQQGVGYLTSGKNHTLGFALFNLRSASGPRNEGVGAAGRFTYAPIHTDNSTLHLGISASTENANKNSANLSANAAYAGRRGPSQNIATTTGASGESVDTIGLEFAGAFGPLYFQSEYARARFGQPIGGAHDVDTWYVMGSWMLTGEHKPYKAGSGVFGSAQPGGSGGAWELTARYDTIENRDIADREASSAILGLNYYFNRNVRLMFNYTRGDNEFTGDRTNQYALRTQLSF
jgi:phosphate-selective porin OprO and OprP